MVLPRSAVVVSVIGLLLGSATAVYPEDFDQYIAPDPQLATGGSSAGDRTARGLLQIQSQGGRPGSSSCVIKVQGTGQLMGLKSLSIKCTSTDSRFKNGGVLIYAGTPMVNYQRSNPGNFKGVQLRMPNEGNFLGPGNQEPVLFFVQTGKISISGSVDNMSVRDWAVIHIEQGTQATVRNMKFTNNKGVRFPCIAIANSRSTVRKCTFTNNSCTDTSRCHSPAVYATEYSRLTLSGNKFSRNKGHLSGAVMVTAGALAVIRWNTFFNNKAVKGSSFSGAIFHDYCTNGAKGAPEARGHTSNISNNRFTMNSGDFGGAIRLGSPDGGCNARVHSNTFTANRARLTGGAVHVSYCNGQRNALLKNKFVRNGASQFNGQVGYNPMSYAKGQIAAGKVAASGCQEPVVTGSTFTGSAPRYSKPWYFP